MKRHGSGVRHFADIIIDDTHPEPWLQLATLAIT